MPTYTVHSSPDLLDDLKKRSLVDALTNVHSYLNGVPAFIVQVIFIPLSPSSHYIGGKSAPAEQIWIRGDIRAGRSEEVKKHLVERIVEDGARVTKIPREYWWVYLVDVAKLAEFGDVMPAPNKGEEEAWFRALPESVKNRYGVQ